jgi:hypothetical protein
VEPFHAGGPFGLCMARASKLTPKRRQVILDTLSQGLSIKAACEAARIARYTYYEWREQHPDFAKDCDDAIEQGTDVLEDIARKRAEDSSDTLLIFLLKARRSEKYRDTTRLEHTGAGGAPLVVTIGERPDGPQRQ